MKPLCPECGRRTTVEMGFFAASGEDAWYCPHCNMIRAIPDRHQRQYKKCEYCGHEMVIDGTCENCEIMNDTRREDWEYDQYRRIDAQDLADAEQVEFPDEDDER